MKLWIDTEFTDFKGSLISMALVDENGEYFYEVIEYPTPSAWVTEHVIPILGKEPCSKEQFEQRLYKYLSKYSDLHIIADWPDDIKYFCEVIHTSPGECMNLPNTLTFEIVRRLNATSDLPHNALSDAMGIRAAYLKKDTI